ncbi:MAG: hypothetical protein WBM99_13230, partial [Psychromonas sp.]
MTYYNEKRVQSITFDAAEGQYSGRVVGHGKHIYSTILFVKDNAMTTVCSCPVGFQCKHGVAT